jgi:hypothetical protein
MRSVPGLYIIKTQNDKGSLMKTVKKIRAGAKSGDDRDQYLMRFPEGMRQALTALADENGRSINAEIVAALEVHLRRKDRLSSLEIRMNSLESAWHRFQLQIIEIFSKAERERDSRTSADEEAERIFSELKAKK